MALGPILTQFLTMAGLSGLIDWASKMIIEGASEDEITLDMYDQPEFKERFWMIFARRAPQGGGERYPPVSVQEVLEYENQAHAMGRALGVNITQREVGELIANNNSLAEAQDRLSIASQVVHMSSPELRAGLERMYGITNEDLTRYWLNPKEQAPVLQRRFVAAQINEQAVRTGWGDLERAEAEDLAQRGITAESAAAGFGALLESEELFESVDITEEDVSRATQLAILSGDVEAAREVTTRGEKRAAKFQEGGTFAAGEEGFGGLGEVD